MANIFTEVQQNKVATNNFNLSHDVKLSLNMGQLIPVCLTECIPGDTVKMSSQIMARLAPMIAPVMHKIDIDLQHFFVPNRILWAGWEKFITAGTPDANTPAVPYFSGCKVDNKSLADYFGLPITGTANPVTYLSKISALPFAAYQKIWYDYYRDQNLQNEESNPQYFEPVLSDGLNYEFDTKWNILHNRAWEHDYFTSALPWAQKGEAVNLALGTTAQVKLDPDFLGAVTLRNPYGEVLQPNEKAQLVNNNPTGGVTSTGQLNTVIPTTTTPAYVGTVIDPNGSLYADLSSASAVTINSLRWAVKLQEYLERNARGGTRYIEHILSHFGVRSSDKRLQRPEFLGGSRQHMVISEVLQNSESETTPQGNMAGHGISVGGGKDFSYYVEEHGYCVSIISIRPKTAYMQGLHKSWTRFDPLQYAWPTFANVGEQEILNQELFYDNQDGKNAETFGYIPRYSEYKYKESTVHGDFRESLSYWHMARRFNVRPLLNAKFIESDPTKRIFAVEDPNSDSVYMHILHTLNIRRKLPVFGTPVL